MTLAQYSLIFLAGLAAGYINTVAGSGSMITLPALIAVGLPAPVANATNRIGILMQCFTGAVRFRNAGLFRIRESAWFVGMLVAGSYLGALIAVDLDQKMMERAIGMVLIVLAILVVLNPDRFFSPSPSASLPKSKVKALGLCFLLGIYTGFIQVSASIFLVLILVMGAGLELVKSNAVKVFIMGCSNIVPVLVFHHHGLIHWRVGVVLGVGNLLGAWVATTHTMARGKDFLRWSMIVVVVVSGGWLLFRGG